MLSKVYARSLYTLTTSLLALAPVVSSAADIKPNELLNLSLAELSNISVTSVSKTPEKETEAAAAIYVITQEDIRRSGATVIPDLLRMVPGITVTKSASSEWTVTARGFNSQFSNKLLVLIDGRTVYSHLFSGVIWDVQDLMLEDIDRIEVIRGPGATLWGANAVNGVINIISKSAKNTQGGLLTAAAGNQVNGIGAGRYGAKIGEDSYLRTYAKYTDYDSEYRASGNRAHDGWNKTQVGFRSDSKVSSDGSLTVQGDAYVVDQDNEYLFPDLSSAGYAKRLYGAKVRGGNLLGRWEEKLQKDSVVSVQTYFDNAYRQTGFFNDNTNTFDLDLQHSWTGWNRQEIVWGAGYRLINNTNDPASPQYFLTPKTRNDHLFNAFVQDKYALVPDRLFATVGSKFEQNDYSGFEVQPSARMSWLPADNQTVWASVSRAVHTPSRFTDDGILSLSIVPPGALPILFVNAGNRALKSEELIAYELGYRIQPTNTSSIDVAAFYNDYTRLFTGKLGTAQNRGTYIYQPVLAQNANEARSTGIEASAKWSLSKQWQLAGAYSYLNLIFEDKSSGFGFSTVGKQPKHTFNARSTYLFQTGVEMTNALYHAGELQGVGIKGYYRFDTKLSYPVTEALEVSLVGQNLFDKQHKEFAQFFYKTQAEIGRSIYAGAAFKF